MNDFKKILGQKIKLIYKGYSEFDLCFISEEYSQEEEVLERINNLLLKDKYLEIIFCGIVVEELDYVFTAQLKTK